MGRLRGLIVFWILLVAALVAVVLLLPRQGRESENTLRLVLHANPKTLDPAWAPDAASVVICRRLHRTVLRYDAELKLVGDLAASWERDGETAYVFHLRKDALFHNGKPVRAGDVIYSLERLMGRKSTFYPLVKNIRGAPDVRAGKAAHAKGLSKRGEHTVRIELERPHALFLGQMAMINTAVVPREEVERLGEDFALRPVGAGGFQFAEWRQNDRVVLERFEGYRPGPAHIQRVDWRVILEPEQRLVNYEQGRVDLVEVPWASLPQVETGPLAPQLRRWATLNTYYLGFTLDRPPFKNNPRLRKAINYAVDRAYLCKNVLKGLAEPARGVLPPGMPGYNPELAGYAYDVAHARAELARAGYPGGKGLGPIPFYHKSSPDAKLLAERVAHDLGEVGIRTKRMPIEFGALVDKTKSDDPPPMYLLAWIADYPDAENFLDFLFHSDNIPTPNRTRYRDRTYDGLIQSARSEMDLDRRVEIYRLAEKRLVEDAPWGFLFHRRACILVSPRVRGLDLSALDANSDLIATDFTKVRIEEPSEPSEGAEGAEDAEGSPESP